MARGVWFDRGGHDEGVQEAGCQDRDGQRGGAGSRVREAVQDARGHGGRGAPDNHRARRLVHRGGAQGEGYRRPDEPEAREDLRPVVLRDAACRRDRGGPRSPDRGQGDRQRRQSHLIIY